MLRIGDFSKLAQVPIATLRYYDQLGILKPANVDKFTEYRYYTVEQLPRLNRILALKDLGFSLEQVERLVNDNISVNELSGMLAKQQAEGEKEMQELQARLRRVELRLEEIRTEGRPSEYDIVTKSVPAQWIVSTRRIVAHVYEIGDLCWSLHAQLRAWAQAHQLKPLPPPAPQLLNLYYNDEYVETDLDFEAAVLIAPPAKIPRAANGTPYPLTIRELRAEPLMASGMYRGPMDDLEQLIRALLVWVAVNGYEITGPARELHLVDQTADAPLVEMQVPIRSNTKSKSSQ